MMLYPISFFRNQTYWKIRQLQMRRINVSRKKEWKEGDESKGNLRNF